MNLTVGYIKRFFFICLVSFFLTNDLYCLQAESIHFIYYYEASDSSIIDTIKLRLENCYDKITKDLQLTLSSKIVIHIYPTLQEFHNAIGWPDAPDWVVGTGYREIFIVSPLNPGPNHSYKEMVENVIVHEFTHVCTFKVNSYIPNWLAEGFACFEGGPYYSKASVVSSFNNLGRIPSLDELNSSSENFAKLGGYPFSLTIATMIVSYYSMNSMREFIKNPNDYSVFGGLSKTEFQNEWFKFVKDNYLNISSGISGFEKTMFDYSLEQNYPNPFNPETVISYKLPVNSQVNLKIYDILGKEIAILVNEAEPAGNYEVEFDGSNLSNGIYYYKLVSGNFSQTKKMVLVK